MQTQTATKAPRLSREVIAAEALKNATENNSVANYQAIYEGFEAKGIPCEEVEPRVNVFTYNAWRAKGRQVRKGETGVKVVTYINAKGKEAENGEGQAEGYKFSRTVAVFHITQTDPIEPKGE
ncbi:protein of unknown function [Pseudomonas peli]|uniref:N-terminal domain-containing protein n=1 Tax=Pseudomonas peli TaxID=592361 RepID=A0AB37ZDI2_9PSED|nr:ArdC family protein [Pseudomonas peli]NMZ71363.1 ArdC family protein [Pseudomonas peli]SCW90303.1 protein of unknown function [Pseudomonas peli]